MTKKYSVKEVSQLLGTSEETVRRWIRSGKLKANMNSRKQGSVITDSMLKAFVQTKPKYASLITPAGGIAATATILLGDIIAQNIIKKGKIKKATINTKEIKDMLKDDIVSSKELINEKRKKVFKLEQEIEEEENKIEKIEYLIKEMEN